MKNALKWLIVSSADPQKLSLTIKGVVPLIVLLLAWGGIAIPDTQIQEGVDLLVTIVVLGGQVVTAAMGLYGFSRKVHLTTEL